MTKMQAHPMTRAEFRKAITKPNGAPISGRLHPAPVVSPYVARYLSARDDKYRAWYGIVK